ncbi:MAG: hypothetical protein AAF193_00110 [Bacteroidota bacterium]
MIEQIPRGTLLGLISSFRNSKGGYSDFIDVYLAKDRRSLFRFGFYWNSLGYFEVDILSMPSYGSRSSDMHTTHRVSSSRPGGGYKICFGNPSIINSPDIARKWAGIWAELTLDYIKTGKRFPNN